MNQFWVGVGLAIVIFSLHHLYNGCKKSGENSTNNLILGIIVFLLSLVAIDNLTVNYLFPQLGKRYYYWLVGALIDSIYIVAAFRKTEKKFTNKERLFNNLRLVYCLAVFSWYFMYYLCK